MWRPCSFSSQKEVCRRAHSPSLRPTFYWGYFLWSHSSKRELRRWRFDLRARKTYESGRAACPPLRPKETRILYRRPTLRVSFSVLSPALRPPPEPPPSVRPLLLPAPPPASPQA